MYANSIRDVKEFYRLAFEDLAHVHVEPIEEYEELAPEAVRVTYADGTVVATATGKYLPMPSEHISLCEKDFVTSPDALPPTEIFTR